MSSGDTDSDAWDSLPLYEYQALPPGPYLRILHLQPGLPGHAIRCSLHVALLDDVAHRYDALSYEWGPLTEVHAIDVDGRRLYIGPNLWSFLQIIRDEVEVLRLWVDAICIDQNSVYEKNHQVQRMWSVYYGASGTRVFLNVDVDCPELWDPQQQGELVAKRPQVAREAIMKVLNASYWTRLWVVQEIIASREIIVQVSPWASMSWSNFFAHCEFVAVGLDKLSTQWDARKAIWKLEASGINNLGRHSRAAQASRDARLSPFSGQSRRLDQSHVRPWTELILAYGRKQCLDLRDRVYGLNGFASKPVQVDYGLHALQVFANVMNAAHHGNRAEYVEHFADVLWRTLGLHHASMTEVQLHSSLMVRVAIRRLRLAIHSPWEMVDRSTGFRRLTFEEDYDFLDLDVDHRKLEEEHNFFTLSFQGLGPPPFKPYSLLALPRMPYSCTGKNHRTLGHPSHCTDFASDRTSISLAARQAPVVHPSSIHALVDSLEGAQISGDFDSGTLVLVDGIINMSLLAYYHARSVFNFE